MFASRAHDFGLGTEVASAYQRQLELPTDRLQITEQTDDAETAVVTPTATEPLVRHEAKSLTVVDSDEEKNTIVLLLCAVIGWSNFHAVS